jgi:hypothetical protein
MFYVQVLMIVNGIKYCYIACICHDVVLNRFKLSHAAKLLTCCDIASLCRSTAAVWSLPVSTSAVLCATNFLWYSHREVGGGGKTRKLHSGSMEAGFNPLLNRSLFTCGLY